MESKVKGAICSLQEDVKNHINILSLTSWNTQLIINLVIMASCSGCFLRTGIVWKMCLRTHPCWALSWLLWQPEPSGLLLLGWADTPVSARSRDSVSELLACLCLFICSAWTYPCLLIARQAHKMVEKEELEIWWREGNEKPRKQEESWVRPICSESQSPLWCPWEAFLGSLDLLGVWGWCLH